jgi:hypothetical protein
LNGSHLERAGRAAPRRAANDLTGCKSRIIAKSKVEPRIVVVVLAAIRTIERRGSAAEKNFQNFSVFSLAVVAPTCLVEEISTRDPPPATERHAPPRHRRRRAYGASSGRTRRVDCGSTNLEWRGESADAQGSVAPK